MTETDYLISKLADKAGVSVRTIRFYIDEGLLPAPQTRGRYTVYSDEYLDRLELIRRLKDAFLPLKEIRQRMNSLSWEEVKAAIAQPAAEPAPQPKSLASPTPAAPAAMAPAPAPAPLQPRAANSALDYINQLLGPAATKEERLLRRLQQPLGPANPPPPPPDLWERIPLAPGLELHARQPLSPENRSKLDQIVALAKTLFS
jgi:DNA-binding transcriptional MerR regulator